MRSFSIKFELALCSNRKKTCREHTNIPSAAWRPTHRVALSRRSCQKTNYHALCSTLFTLQRLHSRLLLGFLVFGGCLLRVLSMASLGSRAFMSSTTPPTSHSPFCLTTCLVYTLRQPSTHPPPTGAPQCVGPSTWAAAGGGAIASRRQPVLPPQKYTARRRRVFLLVWPAAPPPFYTHAHRTNHKPIHRSRRVPACCLGDRAHASGRGRCRRKAAARRQMTRLGPVIVRGRIRDEFQCPITAQILR